MTTPPPEFLRMADEARERITEVSPEEAKQRIAAGALVLDVRDKEEFDQGHLDGAVNISRGTLEMRIGEAVPDKNTEIVCHCAGGNRGALAADNLKRLGYTNVVNVAGGLRAIQSSED